MLKFEHYRTFDLVPFQDKPPPERDARLLALDWGEELLALKRAVAHAHDLDPAAPTHQLVTTLYTFKARRGER